MIIINFDLTSGVAKLASSTTIKLGAQVPVQVVFSAAPGTVNSIKLALGDDSDAPSVLAYVDTFTAVNDTTYIATLDASDSRLAAFMTGKGPTAVDLELGVTLDGEYQVAPNLSVTVHPAIITGPSTSMGSPAYYTEAETNAAIAAALAGLAPAATESDLTLRGGRHCRCSSRPRSSRCWPGASPAGCGIQVLTRPPTRYPARAWCTGAIVEVNIEFPASANPTIEIHDTGGTLLASVTNPAPAAAAYWYGRFRFDGAAWHCTSSGPSFPDYEPKNHHAAGERRTPNVELPTLPIVPSPFDVRRSALGVLLSLCCSASSAAALRLCV